MHSRGILLCCSVLVLFTSVLHAESQRLSLRAASAQPIEGWQTMRVEHCQGERCVVWVSPTATLTESDIEQAEPFVTPNPDTGWLQRIRIVLTDAGSTKLHDLTAAQLRSQIVLIVSGKVLWAPTVTGVHDDTVVRRESVLAGATPNGLTDDEVDLIMSILSPTQPR